MTGDVDPDELAKKLRELEESQRAHPLYEKPKGEGEHLKLLKGGKDDKDGK